VPDFGVETVTVDLPPLAAAFSRRLHDAGVPSGPQRSVDFARALTLVRPVSRKRLYWTARAVFVSDPSQVKAFDAVFAAVFGVGSATGPALDDARTVPASPDQRPVSERAGQPDQQNPSALAAASSGRPGRGEHAGVEIPVPLAPSDEEVLRGKRFDLLDADELAQLYRLMARLAVAPPPRRTRRARRDRHGERIDLRRTLRVSLRTGGDAVRIARRKRKVVQRRLVLLCDVSGSMEPYARAYLQFLSCAARPGRGAEAFVFATRLTRLTRALGTRNPDRAIQRAAAAAPDWSSGTRIGEALKAFNDRHGRRGMARGAVIVILSDGWERGDPALVGREMERLARLSHRIVWVNPRASAAAFSPRTGGMAAALPHCHALVSGHSLDALDDVIAAIATAAGFAAPVPEAEPDDEPWASAGGWGSESSSSVAMPSGYGPSRGRTTPGWTL
jgi:uncharacterized protein with von Willebrand factor type A (vWA) domain